MAPSRYDWKIVDWDVKPQHNQPTIPINSQPLVYWAFVTKLNNVIKFDDGSQYIPTSKKNIIKEKYFVFDTLIHHWPRSWTTCRQLPE